jgi:hypothetical protein
VLGLPIARQGRSGYRHLIEDSAAIIFLRNDDLDLNEIGELEAKNASTNDNCKASCVDWYGNARPLFIRNRILHCSVMRSSRAVFPEIGSPKRGV